jgi:hypothetical protein
MKSFKFNIIFALLFYPAVVFSAPDIDIIDTVNNLSSEEIVAKTMYSKASYVSKHEAMYRSAGVAYKNHELDTISTYVDAPSSFNNTMKSGRRANIQINEELAKLPPMSGETIYSAQVLGSESEGPPITLKKGDYVVANGRPFSFSENPYVTARFAKSKAYTSSSHVVIYKVKSYKGKPIAAVSYLGEEAEVLYGSGSAFRVGDRVNKVLNNGSDISEVELSEVNYIPEGSNIYHYKGSKNLTKVDFEGIDERMKVKVLSSEEFVAEEELGAMCI